MINLLISRFLLTLEVREPMFLPPFKGSTIRGGFGSTFRRIACSRRELDKCGACMLKNTCPYGFIFESSPPEGAELWGNLEEIPRPFVIEPPEMGQTEFRPGETLSFKLVLIGKAIEFLPYFILVFKELGETGIGKKRARFELKQVDSLNLNNETVATVFNGDKVYNRIEKLSAAAFKKTEPQQLSDRLRIDFKTMTRLKSAGEFAAVPEFKVFLRALFRRISALQYFYCGEKLEYDFKEKLALAETVRLVKNETRWVDWERYSSRQDARMMLGGLVGQAEYEGPWPEFEEFLRWGEQVHVGKGPTFGLGRFAILL